MRVRVVVLCAGLALLAGCRNKTVSAPPPTTALAPTGLHSPWDLRQVAPTELAYDCGPVIPLAANISILNENYRSGDKTAASEAVKNAAYAESSAAVADLSGRVAAAADTYQASGSLPAARCAARLLAAAAGDHAMAGWMSSRSAIYEQTKGLRAVSVAYLKVRDSGVLTPDQTATILAWFDDIAHSQRDFFDHAGCTKSRCDDHNHRASAAAYAVTSVGIAANGHGNFYWGVHKYRIAVSSIDQGGMVPSDLGSSLSLKFNIQSAAALVQIAEYGELNGEPLYNYDKGRLHLLVHVVTRGIVDPTPIEAASKHKKQHLPKTIEGWEIGWATIYVRRFPDDVINGLLQQSSDAGLYAWGGAPFGSELEN
ncbi:MAG TPA: alginate lyase family protein [Acidobacteriaceae bacterium]